MIKKAFLISLAVVLAISMAAVGCEPSNGPVDPGVIELKFAHTVPAMEITAVAWTEWGDMIEAEWAAVKGDDEPGVEFTYYWAMSLLKAHEMYDGIEAGTADIGFYPIGVNPGLLPLNEIARLSFLFSSMEEAICAWAQTYEGEDTLFLDELEGDGAVKLLTWYMMGPYQLHMTSQNVTEPADISGLSIGAEGGILDIITEAGGTAVETSFAMLAESLDLGTIVGNVLHLSAQYASGALAYTQYHTNFGTAGMALVPAVFIMNPDTWDSLPSGLQDLIESKLPELQAGQQGAMTGGVAYWTNWCVDRGDTFTELSEGEIDVWRALAVDQHNDWKGQSAAHADAYDLVQSLIAAC